jgi:hypothetical protein
MIDVIRDSTTVRFFFAKNMVNERYGDLSPIDPAM